MKNVLAAGLVLWLAGCAAQPQIIPLLPESDLEKTAMSSYAIDRCVGLGLMSPETAASGKNFLGQVLAGHRYDRDRLDARIQTLHRTGYPVDAPSCNVLAMQILQTRPQVQATSPAPAGRNQPTFTNCRTTFGQTFCTSY